EVERAGDDVAVRGNEQAGRRAGAFEDEARPPRAARPAATDDEVGAAGGLDGDDVGSDLLYRRLDGLLAERVEVVGLLGRQERRGQPGTGDAGQGQCLSPHDGVYSSDGRERAN